MPVTDIIVLATIVVSMLFGVWRGLVKEALSLAFWIGAVIIAGMFNEALGQRLGFIDNPAVQRIAAFVIIFVITVFIGGLISNLVSRLTRAVGLRATDRALGGLFGLARGIIIVVLVVMLTLPFEQAGQYYSESWTVPYLIVLADYFQSLLDMGQAGAATAWPLIARKRKAGNDGAAIQGQQC